MLVQIDCVKLSQLRSHNQEGDEDLKERVKPCIKESI